MKKYKIALWIASVFSLGAVSVAWGVPSQIYQRTILPQINGGFNLGSSSYKWNKIWGNYVSSTVMSADTVCVGGDCQTGWPAGATPEFTFTTNYGRTVAVTTTNPLYLPLGLSASSTSRMVNVSSTNYTAFGKYWGSAEEMTLQSVGSPTIATVQGFMNLNSAGIQSGATISQNGDYTVDVSASQGTIATGPTANDPLVFYSTTASSSIIVTPSTTFFLGIAYNGGNPVVVTTTDEDNFTYQDSFPIGEVVRENNMIHISQNGRIIADAPGQLIRRFHQTLPYSRDELEGGLVLGEAGTRNVTLTAGYLFDRSNRFTISATSTATGGFFDAYYRDGAGGFTAVYNQTQWDNDSYDDGDGTLATVAANRYANLWWYLEIDGAIVMVYGRALYTTAAAASAGSPPSTLPPRLQFGARLIARTTFQGSGSTFTANDSVWSNTFTASAVTNHANLSNLDAASSGHTGFALTSSASSQAITYVSSTAMSATNQSSAGYFTGTQAVSSTLAGGLILADDQHLSTEGVVAIDSAGLMFHANNWTPIALMGAGGGAGVTFYDGVNVTGNITPVTSATSNLGSLTNLFKNFYTTYTSSTISSIGTVLSGTWNGTAIADAYIASAATWNACSPFAWTSGLNFGANSNSTSTPIWFKSALYSSSTAWLTSELIGPSSANPTVDKAGELAVDTTQASSSLKFHDGTAERALYDVQYKTFTWSTSTMEDAEGLTASTTIPIGVASPQGETWVSLDCFTAAGTVEVEFGDGTNWMDYQKLTTSVLTDTSLSNNTFTFGEKRYVRVGKASSLSYGSCSAGIRQNP